MKSIEESWNVEMTIAITGILGQWPQTILQCFKVNKALKAIQFIQSHKVSIEYFSHDLIVTVLC